MLLPNSPERPLRSLMRQTERSAFWRVAGHHATLRDEQSCWPPRGPDVGAEGVRGRHPGNDAAPRRGDLGRVCRQGLRAYPMALSRPVYAAAVGGRAALWVRAQAAASSGGAAAGLGDSVVAPHHAAPPYRRLCPSRLEAPLSRTVWATRTGACPADRGPAALAKRCG